jgi:hypothetical protein
MQGAVKTLFLFSMFGATIAHADIYMCKDASGRTLTSDRPIPECADRAMREYGNNGMVKKEIPAPLTAEQKREKLAQQEKKKAEDAVAEDQKKSDRALLARFHNEADIEQARARAGASINEQLAQQKKALAAAQEEWKTIQAATAEQKQAGKLNAASSNKLGSAAQKVVDARMTLQDTQSELAQINVKYDQIMRRYRQISEVASAQ